MATVRVVTTNPHKVAEIRRLLAPFGVTTSWLRRTLPEVQADSLTTVARGKLAAVRRFGTGTVIEDSGLFVASLGDFPGVYSAPFLRSVGLAGMLRLLDGEARRAEYRAVVGLVDGRRSRWFSGRCPGSIAVRARGQGGFGYDPIFVPDGARRTFGEMSDAEKDALSHRGAAVRALGAYLVRRARR